MTVRRRSVWPWVVIAVLGSGVVVLLGSFVWRLFNPPVTPFVEQDGPLVVIQVDIVNASNIPGAGRRTMMFLRDRGFDVVEISTADTVVSQSHIFDRLGDRVSAMKIAHVLGLADSLIVPEIDSMLFVRASVVLGTDCRALTPFSQ